jgi:hypothetical protein
MTTRESNMEYLTGGALVAIGFFFLIFGSGRPAGSRAAVAGTKTLARWLDLALQWGIGLLCLWFGGALMLGHSHFF